MRKFRDNKKIETEMGKQLENCTKNIKIAKIPVKIKAISIGFAILPTDSSQNWFRILSFPLEVTVKKYTKPTIWMKFKKKYAKKLNFKKESKLFESKIDFKGIEFDGNDGH